MSGQDTVQDTKSTKEVEEQEGDQLGNLHVDLIFSSKTIKYVP